MVPDKQDHDLYRHFGFGDEYFLSKNFHREGYYISNILSHLMKRNLLRIKY